jgi:hypothetical protein
MPWQGQSVLCAARQALLVLSLPKRKDEETQSC